MNAIHRGYFLAAVYFDRFVLPVRLGSTAHDLRFFWATSVGVVLAVAIN